MFGLYLVLPTPPSAPSRGGGQGNLTTCTVAEDCVFLFSLLCMLLCFFFATRFQLGTSSPRGTVGCATFPFRVDFRHFVSPPHHDGGPREGFDVGFVAPAFSFSRLSSSSPPPATLAVRGRVSTVVCLHSAFLCPAHSPR